MPRRTTPRTPAPPADLLARCLDTVPAEARTPPLSGRPTLDRASLLRCAAITAALAGASSLWFIAPDMRGLGFTPLPGEGQGAGHLLAAAKREATQVEYVRVKGRALTPVRPTRETEHLRFDGPWLPNQFVFDRRHGSYSEVSWDGKKERRLTLNDGRAFWRRGDVWQETPPGGQEPVNPALTTIESDPRRSLTQLFPGQSVRDLTHSVTNWKGRPAERFAFVTESTNAVRGLSREGVVLFVAPGSRRLMAVQRLVVRGTSWDEMFAEFEFFYDRRAADTALFDLSRFIAGARRLARTRPRQGTLVR